MRTPQTMAGSPRSQGYPNCADGAAPFGALVQGSDGNFYGTTYNGGTNIANGTIFRITPAGTLTTLYTWNGEALPSGTLVQATDGNFYGTTAHSGTVFKMTPGGTVTTLAVVGGFPYAGLVQGPTGTSTGRLTLAGLTLAQTMAVARFSKSRRRAR